MRSIYARYCCRRLSVRLLEPSATTQQLHRANDLATHFTTKVNNVRQSTATATPPVIRGRVSSALSTLQPVTAAEVTKLLTKVPAKHCRLDPVPTWLVKRAAAQFAPILATLCNASFQAGSLPTSQKHALVSARLKKPQLDPADTNSYRPISQLSFASKLVERAVATRFVQHCTQNSLLPARQSAYRRHFSTETALLIVHNDIVRAVDRGDLVPLVLLDLSAAFDTVDHGCLLSVLERRFCVDGNALEWFKSYLSDRSQTFTAGQDSHGPVSVSCSVPQGSVLGPIEFIAYTEDVTELIAAYELSYHLFADDKQLYTAVRPSEVPAGCQRLVSCISDLQQWCASRRLQLNASKTELIWLGPRAALQKLSVTDSSLVVGSTTIQPSSVVRNLGVLFDSELTFKHHVSKIVSSCFYQLRRLRQLKRHVDVNTMKLLISAFILSRLDYCNVLLSGLPMSTIRPLQRAQNAAARLALGLSPRDHVFAALKKLHWLPVTYRIQYKLSLMMFLVHSHQCPGYMSNTVSLVSDDPGRRRLRSAASTDYHVPRTRTKLGDRAFSIAGPKAWNNLPQSVRSADSLDSFKRKLKFHLFNSCFNV